jgi:hypothetical protein
MKNGTIQKTSVAMTQKSHCNIRKSSVAGYDGPLQEACGWPLLLSPMNQISIDDFIKEN